MIFFKITIQLFVKYADVHFSFTMTVNFALQVQVHILFYIAGFTVLGYCSNWAFKKYSKMLTFTSVNDVKMTR